jgi:hypothetical protein
MLATKPSLRYYALPNKAVLRRSLEVAQRLSFRSTWRSGFSALISPV